MNGASRALWPRSARIAVNTFGAIAATRTVIPPSVLSRFQGRDPSATGRGDATRAATHEMPLDQQRYPQVAGRGTRA